jgi:hypothetical protein
MKIPSVGWIEQAAESLKRADPRMIAAQEKQLDSFGAARAKQLGATDLTRDFQLGYLLGLQTARIVLSISTELGKKGIEPDSVL